MATQESFSFIAIVVVYLTAPDAASTLRTLAACTGMDRCARVVVVDHGPVRQDEAFARIAAMLAPTPAVYDFSPHNPPLGQAYNRAIREHLGEADYALVLDQDTSLPRDIVAIAQRGALTESFPTLMGPHMRSAGRIASPCRIFLGWGRRWASPRVGWQSLRRNTLINSGAWIHRRAFETFDVWYNESLKLYGIDTDFFKRLGTHDPRFLALPVVIDHDLSFDSASLDGKAAKVDAMLAANRVVYADDGWLARFGVRCVNAIVRLRYIARYRSFRFL
jgi:hypothetical protein